MRRVLLWCAGVVVVAAVALIAAFDWNTLRDPVETLRSEERRVGKEC